MVSRRLTKTQKAEILEAYRAGYNTNSLALKYTCTTNTINRTVKTMLSESEYKLLKEERSEISSKRLQIVENGNLKERDEDMVLEIDQEINKTDNLIEEFSLNNEDTKDHKNIDTNFELIEPLRSSYDFDQDKQKLDFELLNYESLPESVYMIVNKKVELELQLLSDLPEWSFLPENELQRNAILLFTNQRSAKRSCSSNQRVIKIPNTSVFKLSKPYLISKGVTRLILEDSIIGLDN